MVVGICYLLMLSLICRTRAACECTGDNKFDESLQVKWGKDYGEACKAWDMTQCHKWTEDPHNMELGTWCCERWCYVDSSCPSAMKSGLRDNLLFSYDACSNEPSEVAHCAKKYEDKRLEDRRQDCKEQEDCQYKSCCSGYDGEDDIVICDVWDSDGPDRGPDMATYKCIHGTPDDRCRSKANGAGLSDGGWCWDGRRDSWCPARTDSEERCEDRGAVIGILIGVVVLLIIIAVVAVIVAKCCCSKQNQHANFGQPVAVAVAMPLTNTVSMQVPQGVSEGQQLQVQTPDGQLVTVTVPPGVEPGQQIRVQVPPVAAVVVGQPAVQNGGASAVVVGQPLVQNNSGTEKVQPKV